MVLKNMHMDSLETLSVVMDWEGDFKIEITDANVEKFITVADIIAYVEKRTVPELKPLY